MTKEGRDGRESPKVLIGNSGHRPRQLKAIERWLPRKPKEADMSVRWNAEKAQVKRVIWRALAVLGVMASVALMSGAGVRW